MELTKCGTSFIIMSQCIFHPVTFKCFIQDLSTLQKVRTRKAGEEPKLVIQLGQGDVVSSVFICGDNNSLSHVYSFTWTVGAAVVYILINLNYPGDYSQLLGLTKLTCLGTEFPTIYNLLLSVH